MKIILEFRIHGLPSLTMSFQMHGLQLVCLEVHTRYLKACFARRHFAAQLHTALEKQLGSTIQLIECLSVNREREKI